LVEGPAGLQDYRGATMHRLSPGTFACGTGLQGVATLVHRPPLEFHSKHQLFHSLSSSTVISLWCLPLGEDTLIPMVPGRPQFRYDRLLLIELFFSHLPGKDRGAPSPLEQGSNGSCHVMVQCSCRRHDPLSHWLRALKRPMLATSAKEEGDTAGR